ncbi:MAG: fimbria/pilus outer membrane usher protein, partial [Enterobacteriaceae bacterium]
PPLVQGIAQTQARIEIRQAGVLIYDALLPPGPFSLTDLPLLSAAFDLDVTVIENDGRQQQFVVPYESFFSQLSGTSSGYSFTLGKVRQLSSEDEGRTPWVVTGSYHWDLSSRVNATAGLQAAQKYSSSGGSLLILWSPYLRTTLRTLFSRENVTERSGMQNTININIQPGDRWSTRASWSRQTQGFRTLSNTLYTTSGYNGNQHDTYTVNLSYAHPWIGSTAVGLSRSKKSASSPSDRLFLNWSRPFKGFNLYITYERDLGNTFSSYRNQYYLTLDIPFRDGNLRNAYSRYDNSARATTSYQKILSDSFNYSLSADRSFEGNSNTLGAQLNLIPRYTQMSLGAQQNKGSTTYNGSLRGGILAHKKGVTPSPYRISDNIGIIQIGDLSGVKFISPSGPVWSDYRGYSVIANLNSYSNTNIQLITSTLPRNVDINNGFQVIRAGHGAVSHLNFSVVTTQRLLLNVTMPDGQPIAGTLPIVTASGEFVTLSGNNGTVFIELPDSQVPLYVETGKQRCQLIYTVPEQKEDELYQTAEAQCQLD